MPATETHSTDTAHKAQAIAFRHEPREGDRTAVRQIIESSGFFTAAEADVAVELVDDWLARGSASDYQFIFADLGETLLGYTCFGEIACTAGSYDLYWIAIDARRQRSGLGRQLIERAERLIAAQGGRRVYVETSSRDQYEPTRRFYQRCGYNAEAVLADFYAPGDAKVILAKDLSLTSSATSTGSGPKHPPVHRD